jgi:hypothetical protein
MMPGNYIKKNPNQSLEVQGYVCDRAGVNVASMQTTTESDSAH